MYGCVSCDEWWFDTVEGEKNAKLHQDILNHTIVKEIRLE